MPLKKWKKYLQMFMKIIKKQLLLIINFCLKIILYISVNFFRDVLKEFLFVLFILLNVGI